ncbi:MAG: FprA family A-type flavoprotein [Muribaculaceae bacterium]|nr:FprA family A-type flavoprotein [Muribaculaceae bacterium]
MHSDITPICVYDEDLDLFESQYKVPEGISYNSYIISDDKTALIDTVDERKADEWCDTINKVFVDGKAPDYLIVQHLEPDHSACIGWVMDRFPDCRLVCTAKAHAMLPNLVENVERFESRIDEVGDGDTLDLGKHKLHFVTAPMVHWPEVMMIYDQSSHTLFSADAFGRFGKPDPDEPWACEARRYFFNIVGKYGRPVQAVLKKLSGRTIETIAPLHGPVLEGDLNQYLTLYDTWSAYRVETPGVLVAYASIHGLTAKAAEYLAEELKKLDASKVSITDLCRDDMAEAVEDAFRMSHLIVLSPTYDGEIFPPMHDFLHHLSLKGFCNRRVAIVENGLWAPTAGRKMKEMLSSMTNIDIVEPVVTLRGRMTDTDKQSLNDLAMSLIRND